MKTSLAQLTKEVEAARLRLLDMIRSLPDDPGGIRLLSKNCAVVSLSEIKKHNFNLSPSYYLAHETKTHLIDILSKSNDLDSMAGKIESLIRDGYFVDGTRQRHDVHPTIIAALKGAWEGEPSDEQRSTVHIRNGIRLWHPSGNWTDDRR